VQLFLFQGHIRCLNGNWQGRMIQENDRDLRNCIGLMEGYTLPKSIMGSSKDEIGYFTRSKFH
jgi:hypothetical protein